MRLRLKSKQGQQTVDNIDGKLKIDNFVLLITPLFTTLIVAIKTGFPPKSIDLTTEKTLEELGVKNGDSLIVETGDDNSKSTKIKDLFTKVVDKPKETKNIQNDKEAKNKRQKEDIPSVYVSEISKYLILRNIPDDNSCLFNAIISGVGYDMTPLDLRDVVVNYIKNDVETYNEVILGRPVQEYCDWILKKDSWGGAIELGILADYLQVNIHCLDIETNNFITFDQEKATKFIILVYSGVHYDLLVLNPVLSITKTNDTTNWPLNQENIIKASAKKLCTLLQLQNYTTNTTTFRIRCLNCYKVLVGEMGASNHANETGHYEFGEVK